MAEAAMEMAYQREVLTAIKNKNDIVFVSYSGIEDTEDKIKFALAKIFEQHDKADIFTPVLSCIKELLANAIKANAKKILIEEKKIENPDDSIEVVKQIRTVLNEQSLLEYGIKAKAKKLSARIYLRLHSSNLIIDVINNLPLNLKEQKKIAEKIERSSKYDNIAEFFMENPDPEAEGMGLGLSMVVVLLKNINISHKNFTITTDEKGKTFARIVIPLT